MKKTMAVVTTAGSREEAQRLARAAVEAKLAACAQISEIESFFHWQGAVQNEKEYRILFKTTDAQYASLERSIKENHSYELPAIHACELDRIYAPYAAWIADNSGGT